MSSYRSLPTGWRVEQFPEAIDFQEGPGILARDFRESGIPLIRLAGLQRGARVLDGCDYLDGKMVAEKWSHFRVSEGDVLLSTSASLGRLAVVDADSAGAVPYTGIVRMRPRHSGLLAPFIRYLLESRDFQDQVEAMGAGSVIRHFGPTHLRAMRVVVPDKGTQQAVVAILSTLDDKIELNRRMNETLEEMARALFKSWFVDFDPVHAKAAGEKPVGMDDATGALFPHELEYSKRGSIPKGWGIRTVAEIQDGPRATAAGPFGSNLTRKDYATSGVPVIRGANMTGSEPWLDGSSFVFVSPEKANELSSNSAEPGDLVFTQRGTMGQVAIIPAQSTYDTFVLSQSQMKLRSKLSPLFLYLYFSSSETIEHIVANSTASGVPHVNLSFLRQMNICPFSTKVVSAFHDMASPWMTRHLSNTRESEHLAALRDTLLPKLLSGELRIKDAEKIVGEVT